MDAEGLLQRVADVERRLGILEGAAARATPDIEPAGWAEPSSDEPVLAYAGTVPYGGGTVTWTMRHAPDALRDGAGDAPARVLAALGSPVRLRIVAALLAGPLTTAELGERLAQPSSGQLFHHLKDLLAARLVHQPVRGTYALRAQDVVPVLAVIAAASDIAGAGDQEEPA